jgi:uncharacterized protein
VRADAPRSQVIEVLTRFDLFSAIAPLTRCVNCNGRLHEVDADTVRDDVPPESFRNHEDFRRCERCAKVYWKGAHQDGIERFIDEVVAAKEASLSRGVEDRVE